VQSMIRRMAVWRKVWRDELLLAPKALFGSVYETSPLPCQGSGLGPTDLEWSYDDPGGMKSDPDNAFRRLSSFSRGFRLYGTRGRCPSRWP
jgi:hypothetical protein